MRKIGRGILLAAVASSSFCFHVSHALVPARRTASSAVPLSSALPEDSVVVVVGGGPVGLATALQLSRNSPHDDNNKNTNRRIVVLEKTQGNEDIGVYNPGRSYLYNINPRGFCFVNQFPNIVARLEEWGVVQDGVFGNFCVVPADPKVPVPPVREVTVTGASPAQVERLRERGLSLRSLWIPRHQFVSILREACNAVPNIEILSGKEFQSLESDAKEPLLVCCTDGSRFPATLVVAADGMNSPVRTQLRDADEKTKRLFTSHDPSSFHLKRHASASTGLNLKALQLIPQFPIANLTTGDSIISQSYCIYSIRGINKGRNTQMPLGCLPLADNTVIRPGNTVAMADHEIFAKIKTAEDCRAFFRHNWPRIDWDAIVDDAEWTRYCQATPTVFPHCQYSPGSMAHSGQHGVVLVGDACHSFPPDTGQGINAGLQDVVALDRALTGCDIETGEPQQSPPPSLGGALENYQSNRRSEHKALIDLARYGSPYQYNQQWKRHRLGKMLWTANVALRLLLSKLTRGLLPSAAILQAQNPELSYAQVMKRAHRLTWSLRLVAAVMCALLLRNSKLAALLIA